MKITTEQGDDLAVRHGNDKRDGHYVELQVETDFTGLLVFLTPPEAERLGNALLRSAQPEKQKEAPTEAQKEQRGKEG